VNDEMAQKRERKSESERGKTKNKVPICVPTSPEQRDYGDAGKTKMQKELVKRVAAQKSLMKQTYVKKGGAKTEAPLKKET